MAILPREQCGVAAFSKAVHELACCYPLVLGGYFYAQMLGQRGIDKLAKVATQAAEQATPATAPPAAPLAGAPLAIKACKQMLLGGLGQGSVEAAFATDYPAYSEMLASQDAQEGMAAFNDKRPSRWTGR